MQIHPSKLSGRVAIPPSKSQTFRAILFASLASGESVIENLLNSPDTEYLIEACRHFGAQIHVEENRAVVVGAGGRLKRPEVPLYVGNSGIALRFLSGVAASQGFDTIMMGDDTLQKQRPMAELIKGLKQLGAQAASFSGDGCAPVKVIGPLQKRWALINGRDSQPVSALLIAAALSKGHFEIVVKQPGEKPWVAMTVQWLQKLGVRVENDCFERFSVHGGAKMKGFHYTVPADYSSAAFPLVAALITGSELFLDNLDRKDLQGDKKILDVLKTMGASIEEKERGFCVKGGCRLKGQTIDVNEFIDAVTILAVAGCFAEGETVLTNGGVARTKECDRLSSIASELKKMGADIEQTKDGIRVRQSRLKGCVVDSFGDHRMALSLAVAGMGAEGRTVVKNFECVGKTYSSFIQDFQRLGADIS